ncbi:hypothetical protein [Sulfurovum sp.]|uniref:hypothetical protein n=1 Tax=Sulfurovum sp. TaxID=1969726 RepID=UPI002867D72A|nr:hypothetical protein [Sulfurovum sp.]
MGKTSEKKSYTEDVVLNKILKDISEENIENTTSSSPNHSKQNTYEDDLIKHYKKKEALETREKYINIIRIITVLSITIFLIVLFTNYIDSITEKETPVKKTVTPTSIPQPKVEKVSKPAQVESVIIETKDIIPLKVEPKKMIPAPIEKPVKKVKTERELAKEMLLLQMKN